LTSLFAGRVDGGLGLPDGLGSRGDVGVVRSVDLLLPLGLDPLHEVPVVEFVGLFDPDVPLSGWIAPPRARAEAQLAAREALEGLAGGALDLGELHHGLGVDIACPR